MELLWSRAGATGSWAAQSRLSGKRLNHAECVAHSDADSRTSRRAHILWTSLTSCTSTTAEPRSP